jgi:hypothetical protein
VRTHDGVRPVDRQHVDPGYSELRRTALSKPARPEKGVGQRLDCRNSSSVVQARSVAPEPSTAIAVLVVHRRGRADQREEPSGAAPPNWRYFGGERPRLDRHGHHRAARS